MIAKRGRKTDKEKAARLTLWDREALWLRLFALITGRELPASPLYPRPMDGIEPFHFEVGCLAPCRDYEMYPRTFRAAAQPRMIDQKEFDSLVQFLKQDDPFSDMARNLCYQLVRKVKEYRDQITEEVVIPRDWEAKAKALHLRLKRGGGGLSQFKAAEKLDMEEQTFRRREKSISVFYLWLRQRVRR